MAETPAPAKRASKKKPAAAKRSAVSDEHKKAMAKGREEGAVVNRYLNALEAAAASKRRGRKRTPESIEQRISALNSKLEGDVPPTKRLEIIEERRQLESELETLSTGSGVDPEQFADDFVKVVKGFSERKGITYGTWREVGVPAAVLAKAGVRR